MTPVNCDRRIHPRAVGLAVLGTLLGCVLPSHLELEAQVPVLVSTEWLAEHLEDPELVVLQVGMSHRGSPEEFIPGSGFLDYHEIAAMEQAGLSTEIPPVEQLVSTLRAAGVSNENHVVVYGSPGHVAARVFMTLDYLGHGDRTSVLDGGLEMWKAEGRPTEPEARSASKGNFTADVREDLLVSTEWVLERLDDPAVTLIDARPESEYSGERTPGELKPGHIPGAYNLYWEELLVSEDRPVLRRLAEVQERFTEAGAREDGTVVSYCYIGMRASYTYMISRHLGYDARFYDGSWNEWGARDDTPAVEGVGRR